VPSKYLLTIVFYTKLCRRKNDDKYSRSSSSLWT